MIKRNQSWKLLLKRFCSAVKVLNAFCICLPYVFSICCPACKMTSEVTLPSFNIFSNSAEVTPNAFVKSETACGIRSPNCPRNSSACTLPLANICVKAFIIPAWVSLSTPIKPPKPLNCSKVNCAWFIFMPLSRDAIKNLPPSLMTSCKRKPMRSAVSRKYFSIPLAVVSLPHALSGSAKISV